MYVPEKFTQHNIQKRMEYLEIIDCFQEHEIIYLDEFGSTMNMTRAYARAPEGEFALGHKPISSGTRISTIGALSQSGMETAMCFEGTLNGDLFMFFLTHFLLPILKPGQIIVMDNCTAHKVDGVKELIRSAGAGVVYLPPYSPELNPIELAWAKVKIFLRTVKARTKDELYKSISGALETITENDALSWFHKAETNGSIK